MRRRGTAKTLNIVVGVAPVKPAEYVIFRIGQGVAGAEVVSLRQSGLL